MDALGGAAPASRDLPAILDGTTFELVSGNASHLTNARIQWPAM